MSKPNDCSRLADMIAGELGSRADISSASNANKAGYRIIRKTYALGMPSAALNANASNVVAPNAAPCFVPPVAGRVLGVSGVVTANVTAAGGNNATLAIVKLAAGATDATVATANTNTTANGGLGNLVLGVPFALTVTSNIANARYTALQPLALALTENSSGVALPAGQWFIHVEEESPVDGWK